jgi:Uma2 family endonuclease
MATKGTPKATKHPPHEEAADDLSFEYPSSDGEPMAESDFQYIPLTDTVSALRIWFGNRTDVYIAGDMLVYYRKNDNTTRVAPDVFAVFGATGNHSRDSWLVWREGKAPDFVLEIASQGTWRRDVTEKRDIYAGMGVTEYWRFDPTGECFTPALAGERLADIEYREIPLSTDDADILRGHSAILGLDICVLPSLELRLYDPESGEWLRTPQEEAAARQAAERARQTAERAWQAEAAARQAAEDENRRLREQLRQMQSRQ